MTYGGTNKAYPILQAGVWLNCVDVMNCAHQESRVSLIGVLLCH